MALLLDNILSMLDCIEIPDLLVYIFYDEFMPILIPVGTQSTNLIVDDFLIYFTAFIVLW